MPLYAAEFAAVIEAPDQDTADRFAERLAAFAMSERDSMPDSDIVRFTVEVVVPKRAAA